VSQSNEKKYRFIHRLAGKEQRFDDTIEKGINIL
jgi:hypothetical protein